MFKVRKLISNTFLLLAGTIYFGKQFLMLKGPNDGDEQVECMEHMEKFWHWLAAKGISSHRSGIVRAIAEKLNSMMPGIYDPEQYDDVDDDDEE